MAEETAEDTTRERSPDPPTPAPQLQDVLAENPLQPDEALPDHDSTYDDVGSASYVTSLRSSIVNYKYQNGRRYHAFREGAYLVPNDEEEQDRMDLVHHIYRLVLGGRLHLAPIGDNPQRVLDLGTGTGIWAMDFADEHPSAEVIGTDLSPIQPKWTPPNCVFEVDDFESEWLYHTPFDFIHARELGGCIANEEQLFQRAFHHLAPGGYIELQAVYTRFVSDDGTAEKASNAQLWMKTLCEGMAKFGKPIDNAPQWKEKLRAAGFVDTEEEVLKIPIGPWPKDPKLREIGGVQHHQELQAVESYTPGIFTQVLGWTEVETQVFIAKVKKELKDPSIHLYFPVYFVWGRKP
ncbi:Demethylmenaquinone methyltransferase [Pleurostoma richardsiae]|uniref:Demethylmenaquinone methyltransferase n=1 Tax=Pleurostoma richardsiae TaxID=41990 RepID=A0AA38VFE2_9PEZI|nr:Demethylmenaquinone methyltransferase [Pleurostoma richardsiae]